LLWVPLIGFLFGFIGSMPLAGPIAVLVFATALEARPRQALYIGLGCAFAEAAYATLAFWGFSRLLDAYPAIVPISRAAAAVILLGLGIAFVRRKAGVSAATPRGRGRRGGPLALGFSITALNPTLIATWTGATTVLFSTGAVAVRPEYALLFGLSAGAGIALWYVVLVRLVTRFRDRFQPQTLNNALRVMGVLLLGVGGWFVWQLASYWTAA
jgi:threonine/homoserine/homoserine lactone efflux protein